MIRAHRQRLSCTQTHQPPAAAVGCCRGDRREQPTINAPRPSPSAPLRRTRQTLTNIAPPNRLQSQKPLQLQPRSMPPYGVNPMPAGGQGRPRQQLERRNPIASQRFAPQSSTQQHMRPPQTNARQKTTTLRRSGSFGFGQQGTQHKGSVATAVYIFSGMPLPRCLTCPSALLPVPKALRPPLHLSKRMAGSRGAPPQMRYSVRPLCVQWPPCPKPASRSAAKAASVGQSAKYKSPGKGRCRSVLM